MSRKPHSEETKQLMRVIALRNGNKPSFKGFRHSEESKKKMSEKRKGVSSWNKGKSLSEEHKERLAKTHRGIPLSLEHKRKVGLAFQGEKHWNWKGGITGENRSARHQLAYKEWRRHVFQRDDWTCQTCGIRGVYLQADHVMPFAFYPELRTEILNGRTLCIPCHRKTPTFANRKDIYVVS